MSAQPHSQEGQLNAGGRWVGASVPRREDPRLLTGRGRYIDDLSAPGLLHAQFVRSTEAHATITAVDLTEVTATPGVVAAFTADDLNLADMVGRLNEPANEFRPAMPVLAHDTVRFVGEPIAIVIAKDPYAAEDGVEVAIVDYRSATGSRHRTSSPGAGRSATASGGAGEHLRRRHDVRDRGHRRHLRHRTYRDHGRPPKRTPERAADGDAWRARGMDRPRRTDADPRLYQIPHSIRDTFAMCAGLDERNVRVIVPDMGGGFGQKSCVGREELATAAAAMRLRQPVKWIEDRRDNLTAAFLGREQHYVARGAFDVDGHLWPSTPT